MSLTYGQTELRDVDKAIEVVMVRQWSWMES